MASATLVRLIGEAPRGFVAAPGERVAYRHRRRSPLWAYAGLLGIACALMAATTPALPAVRAVLAAAAPLLLVAGVRSFRGGWLEDEVVTDRRVVRVLRGGESCEVPLAWVERASIRAYKVEFATGAGPFTFPHVPSRRAFRRAMERVAPGVAFTEEIDLACPT